jgi:phage shock protein A
MGALLIPAGCRREGDSSSGAKTPRHAPPPKNWTSEEIAKDPEGYLLAQDQQVEKQIQERNQRLQQLSSRRNQVQEKQGRLAENLKDIQNVHDRLEAACRRADDEDRWPARMGGRTFDRDKAKAILQSCQQYTQDRQPLAQDYDRTLEKLAQLESQMRKQIQDLSRLRERIAIDVERIRLNQGIAELGNLRQTETELASFSKMLGTMDENVLDTDAIARKEEPPRVDVEALLK